jgi:hypothetical protein
MNIRDKNAKDIEPGQTLERIVDGNCAHIGHIYKVIQRDWHSGGEGEDLIASGGFINELITPERAKEYVIVTQEL